MKIKVKDQLHISSVRADTLRAGEQVTVSDPVGKDLVKRGLAIQVDKPKAKRAAKPENKKAAEPANKAG